MKRSITWMALALALLLGALPGLTEGAQDPFGKYDPPITARFVRSTDDTLDTNFFAQYPDKTMTDNLWTDLYRDELGIIVDYDWIVKGGDEYTQKLNIALASGDIPEFLNVSSVQLKQLAEADMIMPLDEIYAAYAAPLTDEILRLDGDAPFEAATYDGKLYGLPVTDSSIDSAHFIWIRTDWLEKLNLKAPTTMEELQAVMMAFAKADFDGNGVDDSFGMVFTQTLWDGYAGLRGFFNGYDAYPQNWVDRDGKLVYGATLPGAKQALAKLNEFYKLGLIDPEFGVKDGAKVAESTTSGKAGLFYGAQWNPLWPLQSNKDLEPDAQWKAFPIVAASEDIDLKVQSDFGTQYWTVVRKDVEHPEAVVKLFNMFIEKCWGATQENNVYYAPLDSESIWKLSPVTPTHPLKNLNAFLELDAAREANDFSTITGEAASILAKLELFESGSKEGFALWGWERIYGEEGAFDVMRTYKDGGMILTNAFVGAPSDTMTERMSTLQTMQDEVFTKIILGEAPIDDFDKFVQDFYTLGGEQITADVNEWYQSVK